MTSATALPLPPSRLWRVAQGLGLVLTVALLAGLLSRPAPSLHVLWDMVIPILPATFLLSPMVWRNICPLATLSTMAGRVRGRGARLRGDALAWGWVAGMALLFILVPARRFLFNEHGAVLAGTIAAVALLSVAGGLAFSRRAGFCNSICPVLPVEKLYGQSPLIRVGSAVCPDCTGCAVRGCIDLAGGDSLAQSVGARRGEGLRWLGSPMGAFALVFPGFVLGYFSTTNGSPAEGAAVYLEAGRWMLISALAFGIPVAALRVNGRVALPILGAASLGIYYWYAAPVLATAYGLDALGPVLLRGALLLLIAAWLVRALRLEGTGSGTR